MLIVEAVVLKKDGGRVGGRTMCWVILKTRTEKEKERKRECTERERERGTERRQEKEGDDTKD